MGNALIIGAGYLSRFLIPRLIARGYQVTATTRSPNRKPELMALGAKPALLDLSCLESAAVLEDRFDIVIYSAAAGRGGDRELVFRRGPAALLQRVMHSKLRRFVLTSSIGVYSRDDGAWVDERSPTETSGTNKLALVEGEERLFATNGPATVLRLAGLYGPNRSPIDWMGREAMRTRIARSHPEGYVNWVRIEDAASAVVSVAEAREPSPLYAVVDDEPARRGEFYGLACSLGGHPPLQLTGVSGLGKRVRNAQIKAELGWTPHYATYQEGLTDLSRMG